MTDDGDRLITAISVGVVLFIVLAVGILILAATNVPTNETPEPPEVSWSLQEVNDTHVRITHAGGEPVSTTNLSVTVEGIRRAATWSGTLTEGESGVVTARDGTTIQVYWTGGRERVLLDEWERGTTN